MLYSKSLWALVGLLGLVSLASTFPSNSTAASSDQSKTSYEETSLLDFTIGEDRPGELGRSYFDVDQESLEALTDRFAHTLTSAAKNFSRKSKADQFDILMYILRAWDKATYNSLIHGLILRLERVGQANQQAQQEEGSTLYDRSTDRITFYELPLNNKERSLMEEGKDYVAVEYQVPASVVGPALHQKLKEDNVTLDDRKYIREYVKAFIEEQGEEIYRTIELIKQFNYIARSLLAAVESIPAGDKAKQMLELEKALQDPNFYNQFRYFSKMTSTYPQGEYKVHDVLTLLKTFKKTFKTRTFKAAGQIISKPCPKNLTRN